MTIVHMCPACRWEEERLLCLEEVHNCKWSVMENTNIWDMDRDINDRFLALNSIFILMIISLSTASNQRFTNLAGYQIQNYMF